MPYPGNPQVLQALASNEIDIALVPAGLAMPQVRAGSIVALVVWVFYSAQILFGGAEFAQVYARNSGSHFRPSKNAVAVDLGLTSLNVTFVISVLKSSALSGAAPNNAATTKPATKNDRPMRCGMSGLD